MRIVGGSARGREIKSAPSRATRATSDKVRGAIFDILAPDIQETTRVLDLYAGTGALGIEALSRGATAASFVEQNTACCAVIRTNLALCGFGTAGRLLCTPVAQGLSILEREADSTADAQYDLILLDPPYDDPLVEVTLDRVGGGPLMAPDGIVVLEHARRRTIGLAHERLIHWRTKVYGDTAVTIWRRGEDSGNS